MSFANHSENLNFAGVKTRLAMKMARRIYWRANGENTVTGIARAIEQEIPLEELLLYFRDKADVINNEVDVRAVKILKALDIQ